MAFTEDLAVFINADTPGYVLATVGGVEVGALFDNDTQSVAIGFSGMEAKKPSLVCDSDDVSSAVHGTTVVIDSVNYTVGEIYHDGQGVTTLELKTA